MWSFFSGNASSQDKQQPQKQSSSSWTKSLFGGSGASDQQPEKASEIVVTPAPKLTKENYVELGQKMVADFIQQSNAGKEEGWEGVKVQDEVIIDRKASPNEGGLDTLRGTLDFELPPEEVFNKLVDSTHLKYVDYYYETSKVVEVLDEQHSIVHYVYAFPWPMAKREFVCLEVYIKLDDNTWLAISSSVDSDVVPADPAIVRGNLLVSGYLIKSVSYSTTACTVTTLTQVDTGGYLPKWVINKDALDQPLVLARIKKWLEQGIKTYNQDK